MIAISKELTKSILVVEDSLERQMWFAKVFNDIPTLYLIVTAVEAIELVKSKKWDIIFLDHDLGNRVDVDSDDPNTGFQVMRVIISSINRDTPIIVHSLNPVGVANIKALRPDNTFCIPFFNLQLELEVV
jgi:CheY-like chemotaxis protein